MISGSETIILEEPFYSVSPATNIVDSGLPVGSGGLYLDLRPF